MEKETASSPPTAATRVTAKSRAAMEEAMASHPTVAMGAPDTFPAVTEKETATPLVADLDSLAWPEADAETAARQQSEFSKSTFVFGTDQWLLTTVHSPLPLQES